MLDIISATGFQDFGFALSHENHISDWYKMHVRLAETLGLRIENDQTRYLFSDEPSLDVRGRAMRIRAISEDVCQKLEGLKGAGVFRLETENLIDNGDVQSFAVMLSTRSAKADCRYRGNSLILRKIEMAGLTDIQCNPAEVRRVSYKVRKGLSAKPFTVVGAHVRFQAKIKDLTAYRQAMIEGVGRDKGLGFGILTPIKEKKV